jgi:hypothetical protein
MQNEPLTDSDLDEMQQRVDAASEGPWRSFIEGRDHTSGDDFIHIGTHDEPDMYVTRDTKPADAADLDFIAHARQDIPRLISEVRRLRG